VYVLPAPMMLIFIVGSSYGEGADTAIV
jgi:hypothetical protein